MPGGKICSLVFSTARPWSAFGLPLVPTSPPPLCLLAHFPHGISPDNSCGLQTYTSAACILESSVDDGPDGMRLVVMITAKLALQGLSPFATAT